MKKLFTLSLLILSCTTCTPNVIVPAAVPHAPATVQDTNLCPAADANLQRLACIPVGQPYTLKGKSFTEFCQETQNNGVYINPKCLSQITTCSQEDACNNPTTGN